MSIKQAITGSVKKLLASQGYILTRASHLDRYTMESAFRALAERNHTVNTVIDVGASNGCWSSALMKFFPQSDYFLIEAQPVHEAALQQFCSDHGNSQYVLAAAGDTSGQLYFDATDPFAGQASYTPYAANNIVVPVTTIDHEVQARQLKPPYLIKLDTHGFEIPILKGAMNTLKRTEVIVVECYNFKIAPECLLFFEMCEYLKGLGFRCVDLIDVMHRPYDGLLWQMDLIFVPDSRPEFSYPDYE